MPNVTKTFKREYLKEELNLPYNALQEIIIDQSRWLTSFQIVFQDPMDGKYYQTFYSAGSTESQDYIPWEDEEEIKAIEVELREVVVEQYVPVESPNTEED